MKFRLLTPGYRNGGFEDFQAGSREEAEDVARVLVVKYTNLKEIVIRQMEKSVVTDRPIKWEN